jgi:hypothetical protein
MAPIAPLGRLERVDLRNVWLDEARDFTPWLAKPENIKILGDAISLELEVEAQEKGVGPYSADIFCKDTATENWVLIENQLERTDHCHLGQLLTYAAGLNAVTIVWVAARFTEEHRAALDWLNEVTSEDINFFGLEVELWRIGQSDIAPKFNVVSSPNDWTKTVKGVKESANRLLTPAKELQLNFWSAFVDYVETTGATFKATKPLPQTWMNFAIGRSGIHLCAVASLWDSETETYDNKHELRAELVMVDTNAKSYFGQLLTMKSQIEVEIGEPLTWHNPEGIKSCKVYVRTSADLNDRMQWPKYHEWLKSQLEALRRVFGERVKSLSAEPTLIGNGAPS